jgi:hypothetical protein
VTLPRRAATRRAREIKVISRDNYRDLIAIDNLNFHDEKPRLRAG